jgi:hypothetical protein
MFKSKKFWLLWIAAVAVALMMPSCSDSPEEGGGSGTLTVPGTYYYGTGFHITFETDGRVRAVTPSNEATGTYTVSGSTFTLSLTGVSWAEGTWTITSNTAIRDSDGDTWTLGNFIPIPETVATLTIPGTYYYDDYLHITFASDGVVRISDDDDLDARGTFTVTGATFTLQGITGADWITGTWTIVDAETIIDSDDDDWVLGTLIPIPEAGTAPTITTASLADGTVGVEYSQTLAATGDTPITWEISDGELPDGLSLTGNTISGTPTVAGMFEFAVTATNDEGSDTEDFTIEIEGPAGPVEIDISELATVEEIQAAIQDELDAGNDVEVIGAASGLTGNLTLIIPEGRTVTWEAEYAANAGILFGGAGDFTISDGKIETSAGTAVNFDSNNFGGIFTVSGGEVITTGSASTAIYGNSNGNPTVRVTDGRVQGGGNAIATASWRMTILIEGGTIHSSSNLVINLQAGNSRLHISGGTISRGTTGALVSLSGANAEVYVSGSPQIAESGIHRQSTTATAVGYYTGDNLGAFNTETGNNIWTVGTNLHNETPDWAE